MYNNTPYWWIYHSATLHQYTTVSLMKSQPTEEDATREALEAVQPVESNLYWP